MRYLLIADDLAEKIQFLENTKKYFSSEEIKKVPVLIARTSEEAVALVRQSMIGAAFIDYNIPKKNGPWIIQELRKIEAEGSLLPSYLCLFTSASGDLFRRYKEDALKAGANNAISSRYIDKNPADVVVEILNLMQPYLVDEKI
jgi:CheY-like chemotaxis protein